MFIDNYGRSWNHKPDHNTDHMLQVDPDLMLLTYQLQVKLRAFEGAWREGWPAPVVDCYLLRMSKATSDQLAQMPDQFIHGYEWAAGVRLSDEPSDYLGLYIDSRLIAVMIDYHKRTARGIEWTAIEVLLPFPFLD